MYPKGRLLAVPTTLKFEPIGLNKMPSSCVQTSDSTAKPDASVNCWRLLLQWGHSSGDVKLKVAGGCKRTLLLAIALRF